MRMDCLAAVALTAAIFLTGSVLAADSVSGASANAKKSPGTKIQAVTSASIVPESLRSMPKTKGFTDDKTAKVLFVVADPRLSISLEGQLVANAIDYFQKKGYEVEVRNLYELHFDPIITQKNFYNAKDGIGLPSRQVETEQKFVSKADLIVFCEPNWHDAPNPMLKGYQERVFAKLFAYRDGPNGLEGLLKGKGLYHIMNAGWVGGGQGFIGDGIGQHDAVWNKYMNAYKVFDDDIAAFWGMKNYGRFINDQTPANTDPQYGAKLANLRAVMNERLDRDFADFNTLHAKK